MNRRQTNLSVRSSRVSADSPRNTVLYRCVRHRLSVMIGWGFGTRINHASTSLLENLIKGSNLKGYVEHRENGDIYLEASIPQGWEDEVRRDDFEALLDDYSDAKKRFIDL